MRYRKLLEFEIEDYLKRYGKGTLRDMMAYFNMELIDPPNPVRLRQIAYKLYSKGKLFRRRVKASHGVEFEYYLKDSYIKEENNNIGDENGEQHIYPDRTIQD